MTLHAVLLGDSVFDNGAYTGSEPDVSSHLRDVLGNSWTVTSLAVDGSTTNDVDQQFTRIPDDTSSLVLSLGGNDALMCADLLDAPATSTGEALDLFRERVDAFEIRYANVLDRLVRLGHRLVVCTIYNGNLDAEEAGRARVALALFNDVIVREALRTRSDVLELRAICRSAADLANPIEPSGPGGAKIARAIGVVLTDEHRRASRILGAHQDDA